MTRENKAALALVVGTIGTLVTMGLHPTGAESMQSASHGGSNIVGKGVHVLALAVQPLLIAGMLVLTLQLRQALDMAVTAFIAFALGIVAVMIAAAASGLISMDLIADAVGQTGVQLEATMSQVHLAGAINQAFAKVYVGMMAAALILWSRAMRSSAHFPVALSWLGYTVGVLALAGILSGHLRLDVHGFGAVMIAQALWVLWTASAMRKVPGHQIAV